MATLTLTCSGENSKEVLSHIKGFASLISNEVPTIIGKLSENSTKALPYAESLPSWCDAVVVDKPTENPTPAPAVAPANGTPGNAPYNAAIPAAVPTPVLTL
jgi:hypothetical protein